MAPNIFVQIVADFAKAPDQPVGTPDLSRTINALAQGSVTDGKEHSKP
jgi:hypothetical protein